MLKEKKELIDYLKSRCGSLVFNQEKLNTVITEEEDGMIFSITSGTKEIDNNSVNYEFFDEKGRMIMWVTVLENKK